jgi:hypothetical protein
LLGRGSRQPQNFRLALVFRKFTDVVAEQREVQLRSDDLDRPAIEKEVKE